MIKEKVVQIYESLKSLPNNKGFIDDIDLYSFVISLLPLPGVQQAGQVVNKIATNQALNLKFNEIKEELYKINSKIAHMEHGLEKVQNIANTVRSVSFIEEKVIELLEEIDDSTEFIVETSTNSVQMLIKQIVEADFTSISAVDYSRNYLLNTQIKSRSTHLRAHNNSMNVIDGTDFNSDQGSVGMNGISQQGEITVHGSGIGFGAGGKIVFGDPNKVTGQCPYCYVQVEAYRNDLLGKTHVICPNPVCAKVIPFYL